MLPLRCDDTLLKMQLAWVMPRNAAGVLLASFGKPVFSYAPILPPCTWVFKPIQFRKYFPSVFTMSRRTVATTLRVFLPRRSCDASTAAAAAGGARWDNCSHFRGSVRRYVYTQHGVLKCARSFFSCTVTHACAQTKRIIYIWLYMFIWYLRIVHVMCIHLPTSTRLLQYIESTWIGVYIYIYSFHFLLTDLLFLNLYLYIYIEREIDYARVPLWFQTDFCPYVIAFYFGYWKSTLDFFCTDAACYPFMCLAGHKCQYHLRIGQGHTSQGAL